MNLSVRRKASGVMKIVVVLVFVLVAYCPAALPQPIVKSVEAVGMTVSDMDRSIEFFPRSYPSKKLATLKSRAANTSGCREFSAPACAWRA